MKNQVKIGKLEEKKRQIEERLKTLKAQDQSRQKKQDTRRKILWGALLMEWMDQDKLIQNAAHDRLETFLVRSIDRELFELGPRQEPLSENAQGRQKASKSEAGQKTKPVESKSKPEVVKAQKTA